MSGPPPGFGGGWADNPHQLRVAARLLPAQGDPVELPLVSGVVSHDAGTGWRTTAGLSAPYSDDLWALLAGWAAPRLQVDVLLVAPTGAEHPQRVLDGHVRWAGVSRPAHQIDLRAASDAGLVSDLPLAADFTAPAGSAAAAHIRAVVGAALPAAVWDTQADLPLAGAVGGQPAQDRWQLVEQLADAAGLEVYQRQADRVWVIRAQPRLAAAPADTLATGQAGNVTGSGSEYDRDALANGYTVVATWADQAGATQVARGTAYDTDPASPTRWGGPAGKRMQVDTQPGPLDAAACQALAAERLYRRLGAGRGAQLAVPLRPWLALGDTVRVALPYAANLQLVQRLDHDLAALTSSVSTRQPLSGHLTPDPA